METLLPLRKCYFKPRGYRIAFAEANDIYVTF